jgi:hypothetical protein
MKSLFRGLVERVIVGEKPAVVLGRWRIQYDPQIIDCKVFQANEDHCGCCVVPKKEVETASVKNKSAVLYEKTDEYLVPYIM